MRICIRTFLFLMLMQVCTAGAQNLPFTHYTPERELNPLPSAEVHYVYQDTVGYIWFAVYSSGLVRYNGTTMQTYNMADGLRDLTVWEMTEDSKGRLWVTSNAGLVASKKPLKEYETGEAVTFVDKIGGVDLLNRSVNHNRMAMDRKERLWVGTDNIGVVRYEYDESGALSADTVSTGAPEETVQPPVRAVEAAADGGVWVALTAGNLLYFDENERVSAYNTGSSISTSSLYTDDNGTLWGGEMEGRVWMMTADGNPGRRQFEVIDLSMSSNISDITSDDAGNIWISSEGEGIRKIAPDKQKATESIDRKNGLLGNIVFNVFEDREKNIWIAQSGGASKLRYNYPAFKNITAISYTGEQPILPGSSVGSVLYSSNSTLPCRFYAGTSQGGVACISEQFESQSISQEDGLPNNWINGLEMDRSGRLWIGATRGLSSVSAESLLPVSGAESTRTLNLMGRRSVLSIYRTASILAAESLRIPDTSSPPGSAESLWFPGYHAVWVVVGDQLYTMDDLFGLPAVIYHSAAFDGEGYLWLGTRDRGIYRSTEPFTLQLLTEVIETGNDRRLFEPWWTTENGAPSNQIDKMLWENDLMWVGTSSGLTALEANTLEKRREITTEDGLLANNAISFEVSPITGSIWAGTNQGLAEIDPETGSVLRTVTRQDGLVDNEVWFYGSVDINDEGQVVYGTAKGVSIYDPSKDYRNDEPPIVRIERVEMDNEQGERNQFMFEYAALSFGNERGLRYQTRLVGFNDDWSQLKRDTRINYTNLSAIFLPKEYTFEVRAINESKISSGQPAQYSFLVSPPLYLTWWAFLGYLIILSLGVFAVDRFQRARLLKKEREAAHLRETELKAEAAIARSKVAEVQAKALQAENDLKVAELEKARELESAYHELKNTQNRLIQAEKMASLGRLSTGIAHEIKNPLNFINNFSEVSRELVDELKVAIEENDQEEIDYILKNLSFNTEKIDEHGKRADSIVRSMMQHSRGGGGDFEETELNPLIRKYVDLAYHGKKSQLKNLDVKIHTRLADSIGEVTLIPQKIGQVLQNLVENAIDSTREQAAGNKQEYHPEILVKSRQTGDYVEIRVEDNGPGIPEHVEEKIFEPFYTTKPTGEGTGLGLSLSYDFITHIHNGKLELGESELGGAAFVISLPANQDDVKGKG